MSAVDGPKYAVGGGPQDCMLRQAAIKRTPLRSSQAISADRPAVVGLQMYLAEASQDGAESTERLSFPTPRR